MEKNMTLLSELKEEKRSKLLGGMLILTGVFLLLTTTVFSFWGEKITELVCGKIQVRRAFLISRNGEEYLCIPRECCSDGSLYEVCTEEGFFQTNYVLKKISVEFADVFPEENYLVIVTELNNAVGRYFAVLSEKQMNEATVTNIIYE